VIPDACIADKTIQLAGTSQDLIDRALIIGIPGITNYIFSETAARGMYQRWADLLSSESWQEVLDKTAAYQQEVMK
jgi:hypothetical protein